MGEKRQKRTLSKEEKQEWDTLYSYVKDILGYDENQKLTRNMILRLKGLAEGTFMANKNAEQTANYSYKIILLTFKFCRTDIISAFNRKDFQNENHRFLYMIKIIESNINDVYNRYKLSKKSDEQIKKIDTAIFNEEGAKYSTKTKEIKNQNLKKYW